MHEQSFMKSLFLGVIDDSLVFPWPEPERTEVDSLHTMLEGVRRFFHLRVDSATIDRDQRIPPEVLAGLKELGLFGLTVPVKHGGAGISSTGYARVMQELGGLDSSVCVTVGGHQSIGMKALMLFGSPELQERYLPRLATGEMVLLDSAAYRVRLLGATRSVTLAGGARGDLVDGPGDQAGLGLSTAAAVAPDGSVLIVDAGNHALRRLTLR